MTKDHIDEDLSKLKADFPIGTEVIYSPVIGGAGQVTRTRGDIMQISSGELVVPVQGIAGFVSLRHVTPVNTEADPPTYQGNGARVAGALHALLDAWKRKCSGFSQSYEVENKIEQEAETALREYRRYRTDTSNCRSMLKELRKLTPMQCVWSSQEDMKRHSNLVALVDAYLLEEV